MKKIILGIAVIAAVIISVPVFAAQEEPEANVNTEVTTDEFVQVDFQDLPEETQLMLAKEFESYYIKAIYQHIESKLLKVVVVKDEEEKTFIQNEEGLFVQQ